MRLNDWILDGSDMMWIPDALRLVLQAKMKTPISWPDRSRRDPYEVEIVGKVGARCGLRPPNAYHVHCQQRGL